MSDEEFIVKFWQVGDWDSQPAWVVGVISFGDFHKVDCIGGFMVFAKTNNYVSYSKNGFFVHDEKKLLDWLKENNLKLDVVENKL